MKTLQQWFNEYSKSHRNPTNKKIHFICVPAIFFSIVGMLMCIPTEKLVDITGWDNPIYINWAALILIFVLLFYLKFSIQIFLKMLIFSIICLIGAYYLGTVVPLLKTSIIIFVIAWIGQFYGHKIEGKKPSFFKDLQFLLIGPAWIFEEWTKK